MWTATWLGGLLPQQTAAASSSTAHLVLVLMGALLSKHSSLGNSDGDLTVQQDCTSCAYCITTAADGAMSQAKFAGVACQQAPCCHLHLHIGTFSKTSRECTHTVCSEVFQQDAAQAVCATQPSHYDRTPLHPWFCCTSRPSALVKQLAVTIWTGGASVLALQVSLSWSLHITCSLDLAVSQNPHAPKQKLLLLLCF